MFNVSALGIFLYNEMIVIVILSIFSFLLFSKDSRRSTGTRPALQTASCEPVYEGIRSLIFFMAVPTKPGLSC